MSSFADLSRSARSAGAKSALQWIRRIHRPSRWVWAAGVVGLVALLVFNSVMLALRVEPIGRPPFVWPVELDYSRGPLKVLTPLRDFFIERILGRSIPGPGAVSAGTRNVQSKGKASQPALSSPVVISHALTNDSFQDAYSIPSLPFTAKTNTSGAGRESGEPSDCAPVGGTVWYRYVAPADVGLIADTFGTSHPVSLSVLSGGDIRNLEEAGCATHPRGNARVAFAAVKGKTYFFQVASVSGGDLMFSVRTQGLTMRPPISEDDSNIVFAHPSPDGRYIAFASYTPQPGQPSDDCAGFVMLAAPAPGSLCRVHSWLYDMRTEKVVMVSVNSRGEPANDVTVPASMSADGRYVLLQSWATDLVDDDTNVCPRSSFVPGSCIDVFVHDRDADRNGVFDETVPGARKTVRVSVASNGMQGNGHAVLGSLSPDGRYVIFQSWATNLVDGDTNGTGDVFRHDRDADGNGIFDETFPGARKTVRVSVSSRGEQTQVDLSRAADEGAILGERDRVPFEVGNHFLGPSANGRYVMFRSPARNLDAHCTNGAYHVYVHDTTRGTTTCVSLDSHGRQGNKGSRLHNNFTPKISDDGRFAIFNSDATNLVPDDTNGEEDLFVRDVVRGSTERVSVGWDGRQARGEGISSGRDLVFGFLLTTLSLAIWDDIYTTSELNHSMTSDGRYLFFSSGAGNLVPGDFNEARDIFVRDLHRGTTTLVSVSTTGVQGDLSSNAPAPTADGRLVVFYSLARNLDDSRRQSDLGITPQMYVRFLSGGP